MYTITREILTVFFYVHFGGKEKKCLITDIEKIKDEIFMKKKKKKNFRTFN